ncbi:MAG TPA: hypothetical protein DCM59_04745 [Clostridium sp.]|nr:hypothetical protein [Clostridium sp.]
MSFSGELEINLGGVTCLIKEIINLHREDGIIVYAPDEKILFLELHMDATKIVKIIMIDKN